MTLTSAVPEALAFWYAAMLTSAAGLAYVKRVALRISPEEPSL